MWLMAAAQLLLVAVVVVALAPVPISSPKLRGSRHIGSSPSQITQMRGPPPLVCACLPACLSVGLTACRSVALSVCLSA